MLSLKLTCLFTAILFVQKTTLFMVMSTKIPNIELPVWNAMTQQRQTLHWAIKRLNI